MKIWFGGGGGTKSCVGGDDDQVGGDDERVGGDGDQVGISLDWVQEDVPGGTVDHVVGDCGGDGDGNGVVRLG